MMDVHPPSPTTRGDRTYRSPNLKDFTLDENTPERRLPLDNGRHAVNPKVGIGVLEALPLEILHEVLIQIDLRSLTDFRRVNQRATQVVDSIPQYQAVLKHGVASLRSILAIETGTLISCRGLFGALTTPICENCEDFAGFIYLLTCRRVCFLCFTEDVKYLPLLATEVKRRFGVARGIIANLPHMKSVPGCYSPNERSCRARLILYDYESARCAAETYHGSAAAMQQRVDGVALKRLEAYHSRIVERAPGDENLTPRRPPHMVTRDGQASNPKRFVAVVRAPWLNPYTKLEDWGFHCIGCQRQYRARPLHWRRKYSMYTFDDHIRECGQINGGSHCHRTVKAGSQ